MGMLLRRRINEMKSRQEQTEEPILEKPAEEEKSDILTREELAGMTVRQIRDIAESKGITLSKIIKEDVISEFLSKQ